MNDKLTPPKSTKLDFAHSAAKAALSLVPVASEIFAMAVSAPLERRRRKWEEEVSESIADLSQKIGCPIDQLAENEIFVDCVAKATLIAIRNHNEEKREALRNAVFNSGVPDSPDHALQQIFLDLIDYFTEWHLRLINLFQNPKAALEAAGFDRRNHMTGSMIMAIETVYPELQGKKAFCDILWRDIHARGLTDTPSLGGMITVDGMFAKRTTDIGDRFVAFITRT